MAGDPAAPPSDSGFDVARKGYEQGQVDAHLRRLDAEIRILVADRDAAVDQSLQLARELDDARVRAENLRTQVRTLVTAPQSVQGMSERMRSMLRLAEDEVAEMLSRAQTEVGRRTHEADLAAAQIVATAREEADAIRTASRAEAERAAQELAQARAELDAERKATTEQLTAERAAVARQIAAERAQAEQDRSRVWAESESRRALIEEDFTIAMDQRRSEALAGLDDERLDALAEIETLRESAATAARDQVAQAREQARVLVAEAERGVAALVALRGRIAEQLGSTRSVLERSLAALGPWPEELPGGVEGDAAAAQSAEAVTGAAREGRPTPRPRNGSVPAPPGDDAARSTPAESGNAADSPRRPGPIRKRTRSRTAATRR
jgi:chromosome segregation ATPase